MSLEVITVSTFEKIVIVLLSLMLGSICLALILGIYYGDLIVYYLSQIIQVLPLLAF